MQMSQFTAREKEVLRGVVDGKGSKQIASDLSISVKTVDVLAEFERNVEPFKELVRSAIGRVSETRSCTHCLAHTGVTLPIELP